MSRFRQLSPSLRPVLEAAREAAQVIRSLAPADLRPSVKDGGELVTEADREANRVLRAKLLRAVPAGWLSEETVDAPARLRQGRVWIVDPLDGTKEFIRGIPEYAVAVALVEGGQPRLAVVVNPATEEAFWAEEGRGAFGDDRRLEVQEGARLLASRSEVEAGEFAELAGPWDVQPMGSIQYKLAMVASGRGAVTLSRGPKHEWDVCAGALLVAEAGGKVSDAVGGEFRFNQPRPKVRGVVAGSPAAHARALGIIRALGLSPRMAELPPEA